MLIPLLLAFVTSLGLIEPPATAPAPGKPAEAVARPTQKHMEWTVDGVKREGIVFIPPAAATAEAPVVFAFHGHGGNARNAARTFDYQKHWPEAITVYMQGLPTPGAISDPKGERNGWQKTVGDQSDRDLKFFDAVLADLKKQYKVDESRIYATGHSNGGAFTYLLWSARGDVFAAVAPSAAGGNLQIMTGLKPKPAMHIAGRADPLVKFEFQERIMQQDRRINGCSAEGKEWAKDCTEYPSKTNTPFVAMIHAGDHAFPEEAPPLIVKFFKEHAKAAPAVKPDAATPSTDAKPTGSPTEHKSSP